MSNRKRTAEPGMGDFVPMLDGRTRLLVRRGWEDAAAILVNLDAAVQTGRVGGGRQDHPVVELPGGARVVVRRYRRGGLVRLVNREHYFGGNRAFDELRATERARAAGVRVPLPVAAIEKPSAVGYRAAFATVLIPHSVDLAAWLETAPEDARAAVLREAGRQLALMHAAGIAHPDVNLRNLLVASSRDVASPMLVDAETATASVDTDAADSGDADSGDVDLADADQDDAASEDVDWSDADSGDAASENAASRDVISADTDAAPVVYVLDFDRAAVFDGPVPKSRRERELRRLARSARKLRAPIDAAAWAALRDGYGNAWPEGLNLARGPGASASDA